MLDDSQLEKHIRDLLMDICEVMYNHGYEMVHVGAMMRLIGVDNPIAADHDSEYFVFDQEFEDTIKTRKNPPLESAPDGVTLH